MSSSIIQVTNLSKIYTISQEGREHYTEFIFQEKGKEKAKVKVKAKAKAEVKVEAKLEIEVVHQNSMFIVV